MLTNNILLFITLILFIWCLALTFITLKMLNHYRKLVHGTNRETLLEILEAVMKNQKILNTRLKDEIIKISKLESETKFHIQRIGLVRFNPFSDTGGSQSFTVALLDGLDNGIIMTSLYARTGNRWYIKHVQSSKGVDYELSKEEKEAISSARHISKK